MSSATTYTTKAGNLWVFELGASADLWVRQLDRHRPDPHFGTTDLDGLEAHDAANPISLWFRLGEALGLRGDLMLCHNNGAAPGWMWKLYDDDEPVHLFARFDYADAELPMTVVPTLVDGSNEGQLEAILAVVEAAEHWSPLGPVRIRYAGDDGEERSHAVPYDTAIALAFNQAATGTIDGVPFSVVAGGRLTKAMDSRAVAIDGAPPWPRLDSVEGYRASVDVILPPDEKPGQVVYTYEPPEPHPAIARIDAILDRALADLEPRPEDAPVQRRTNRDLADLGSLIRALTTARRELKR